MTTSKSLTSKTSSLRVKSSSANETPELEKSNALSEAPHLMNDTPKQSSKSGRSAISLSSPSTSIDPLCASCGRPGVRLRKVTRSFGRGPSLLLIEDIPLWTCPHCGESYFTAQTLHEIEHIKALRKSVAVDRPIPVAIFQQEAPM
jgi:YgiT-type zinc finger domain-containing protein